jgi:hypothetical protein
MGRTPDPIGDSLELPEIGLDPVLVGEITLNAGAIKARDVLGTFNLRSGTGLTYIEFLLDCDPIDETGATDSSYTATYSGNYISLEEWKRNDTTLLKSIAYTYTGNKLTTEVRKVFAADGTTIVAQVTWSYTYTGNKLTSASMIRNV